MRWYAGSSPAVMHATLRVIERVGEHARSTELRAELVEQVDLLGVAFADAGNQQHDVDRFDDHARSVRHSLLVPH